jgi:hypothetical protein
MARACRAFLDAASSLRLPRIMGFRGGLLFTRARL